MKGKTMSRSMTMSPEGKLSQLINLERAYHNDLEGSSFKALHSEVHNNVWREMIVQWCYNVVDHIRADREIVYVAINVLDRFLVSQVLSPSPTQAYLTDRKDYEAAVMASLLITLKLQGISTLCIRDMLKMSRNSITSKDIIRAAQAIEQSLKWNKQLPTATTFARALVDFLPSSVDRRTRRALFDECIFSIELSVFDKECSCELPSLVAWTILENAMESEALSQEIIRPFRDNVVEITGLKFKQSLRESMLRLRDKGIDDNRQGPVSINGATIIPPDEDDHTVSSNLTLYSRTIIGTNIISMDDIREQSQTHLLTNNLLLGTKKALTDEPSTLPRSKRFRAF